MVIRQIVSRKWLLTTLLALAAIAVMVRLGIWQLDRLEQRRAFNARVTEQMDQSKIELTADLINLDLYQMEYRGVEVFGEYDHRLEVALNNQVWNGLLGIHLLTPLKIAGTETYVLVNRGWIPSEDYSPDNWSKYEEPGFVTIVGVIRRPQSGPTFGGIPDPTLEPGQARLRHWNRVNLERIMGESGLALLPIYVQQAPMGEQSAPPLRALPDLELTEGSHMGYALQWFAFAITLAIGYPYFVRNQSLAEDEAMGQSTL